MWFICMSMIVIAAMVAFALYAVFAVAMYRGQRRLIYRIDGRRIPPARIGLGEVNEVLVDVPGGERLVIWQGRAAPGKPTILYFHGQAGNLARRSERIRRYHLAGLGIVIMAYRGFSGSTGSPSEQANVADGIFIYDWLRLQGVSPDDIVIYGESLGTGVAAQVALQREISGLVLDSPFTGLADLAEERHPMLPVRRFLLDRYETLMHVASLQMPVLVLQGEKDPIVPLAMARAVFEAMPGPKHFVSYPEGRHLDHAKFGSFDTLTRFLRERKRLPVGYCKVERMLVQPAAVRQGVPVEALPARA